MFSALTESDDGDETATRTPRETLAVFLTARQIGDEDLADQVTGDRGTYFPIDGKMPLNIVEIYDNPEEVAENAEGATHITRPSQEERENATLVGGVFNQRSDVNRVVVGWVKDGVLI